MSNENSYHDPPRRWMRFLEWFCDDRFWAEIEGDLIEWYNDEVETYGEQKANRAFLKQMPSYFRLYFFQKKTFSHSLYSKAMFQNYFKTVIRNFLKHKWYASINLLGLTIGFTAFILISIYLHYQTNFESFHSKADRIYRSTYIYTNGPEFKVQWARVPVDYVNELPNEIPEIKKLIRFQNQDRKYVRIGEEKFKSTHAYSTDKSVFEVFDFKLIAGNSLTALAQPKSVILSRELAQKYFGKNNVLGEEIYITSGLTAEETAYQITGVMEDLPSNTHLPVEMLLSFKDEAERSGWAYIYTLLEDGASIETVEAKIPQFIANHVDSASVWQTDFKFQALPDIHLHSNLAREIVPNGNILYVRIFYLVGFFILLIAFINFINLNSALSVKRTKEFGMRKVLGARKSHNLLYAFTESVTYSLIGLLGGAILAYYLFPYFRQLTGTDFNLSFLPFAGFLFLIVILGGFLSGIYPATVMSSLNLITTLKSPRKITVSGYSIDVRRLLVGLQFCASIILIGGALVGFNQIQFIKQKNLGLKKDQILAIPSVPDPVTAGYKKFKEQVKAISGVQKVAACMQVPSEEIRDSGPVLVKGMNEDPRKAPTMDMQIIDGDFMEMMDIEFLAGHVPNHEFVLKPIPAFTEEYTVQHYINEQPRTYIINEMGMKKLGWSTPEEAIGQEISWSIGPFRLAMGPITGVVKDFHQESLKNEVDPLLMVFDPIWLRSFLLELETKQLPSTIKQIGAVWEESFPKYPFEYHFLDDLFNDLYEAESTQIQLLSWFSLLSIFIAAIGLFSLVAYNLQMRMKEIAIRKVLGANLKNLIQLISKEYIWIIIVSGSIAIPISYYGVHQWLENFAYRIDISFFTYLMTLFIILVTLLFIISMQTFWSTQANPADNLNQE